MKFMLILNKNKSNLKTKKLKTFLRKSIINFVEVGNSEVDKTKIPFKYQWLQKRIFFEHSDDSSLVFKYYLDQFLNF
ncbi:hypothetical protein BpHYR1_042898 [Brachionus plicatilis]|uniref:Uncharacterized protein n=1 Tax=Brachionus plicatilis TaxID=10195 RepID=A0A3M7SGU4_BRAPC|nr:hypothetical protein BpHYR1_042898 [Brachionus plicatilis]